MWLWALRIWFRAWNWWRSFVQGKMKKLGSTKDLMFLNEQRNCQFRIKELVKILVVHFFFLKNTHIRSKNEISFPTFRLQSSWPNMPIWIQRKSILTVLTKICWDHLFCRTTSIKPYCTQSPNRQFSVFWKNDLYRIQIMRVNMTDNFYLQYIYIYISILVTFNKTRG